MKRPVREFSEIQPIDSGITLKTRKDDQDHTWIDVYKQRKYIGHFVIESQYTFGKPIPKERCEIWDFRLDENIRKKGIGKKVYQYIEQKYFKPNCDKITLTATKDGFPFWEKMGFEPTSNPYLSSISMRKKLKEQ